MKISLNTVRNIVTHYKASEDVTKIGVEKLVEKIGAQLGAVEEVIDVGAKYQSIIIAKVIGCEKHPDADKLSVCMIDDGGKAKDVKRDKKGLVQVVCGASNVRAGLTVAWLPPGSTVPETYDKDPFVLGARELRGVVSNGMLASPKELALGDSHEGILEIDEDLKPGTDFAEAFGLKDDVVLDIENKMFTHRPDCFGFLGITRELAGIQQLSFKSPEWYVPAAKFPKPEGEELKVLVKNELPKLVPRFSTITMSNVKVGPSPVRLQVELAKIGQKSINNIVDYTNIYMLSTGQPLHAYDYDKVKALSGGAAILVVRHPLKGEKIKLLNGKTIEPRAGAVMIATDKQVIGVGGVMGGAETEVDENTQNIIIEAANFDMYSVRRTSMAHGLFTDAVARFNKGQSPLQTLPVLAKIVGEIRSIGVGKVASPVQDENHVKEPALHAPVAVAPQFINSRLGLQLSMAEIKQLLKNVEFKVDTVDGELVVTAPFWRTDIEIPEDVVEEVGRLYGYDHLPLELPKREVAPTPKDPLLTYKTQIRDRLYKAGANEVLTYSFVHGGLLEKTGQDKAQAYELSNALSPDLQYYRISLMPSLLEKVHPNIKAGYYEFALFEIGKGHSLVHPSADGLPSEDELTGFVYAADDKLKKAGAAYYEARKYLADLAGVPLEFKPVAKEMQDYPITKPYDMKRAALVSLKAGGEFLGIIGEFSAETRRNLKLPKYSAGFEVDSSVLGEVLAAPTSYVPLPRFPKVTQDMTLKVPAELSYQEVFDFVWSELGKARPDQTLASVGPLDIYQSPGDPKHKQITLRLEIASYVKTMTDTEVNKLLDAVAKAAKSKLNAARV